MPYASQDDLIRRYGDAFIQLADRDRDGVADAAVVDLALADADAEIDGWLASRYPVPVSPAPERLRGLAADIAWYRLHGGDADDKSPARVAYLDAVSYLRRVAEGSADLPGTASPAPAASSGGRICGGGRRTFSRASLREL